MSDSFKGIQMPKLPNHNFSSIVEQTNRLSRGIEESMREVHEREERYKRDTLNALKNIEKNTGDISQLVFLLNTNTEKQTEILAVMTEILSIGTSKTEEEAEGKYRTVMNKITQTFEDAETMEKLLGYSKMFYHSAKEYIKYRVENG